MKADGRPKYTRTIITYMVVLALFLIGLDALIVSREKAAHYADFTKQAANEFTIIESFITEPLLQEDFALVDRFMTQWGERKDDVAVLRAFTPKGFLLCQYKREEPAQNKAVFSHSITFAATPLLDIEITKDLSPLTRQLQVFWERLVFQSIIVAISLGLILWAILKTMALKPLEAEIVRRKMAEEKLQQGKDHLATLVQQRTLTLQEQKERLQAITDNVPGLVFQFYQRLDGQAGISYASPALQKIFGLAFVNDPPALFQTFVEHIHDQDRQSFITAIQNGLDGKKMWNWQGRYCREDAEVLWVEGHASSSVKSDRTTFDGILLDISNVKILEQEKKKAQLQAYQSQKMEAIGMMAGGVAHDLNNILAGIISYPELLLLKLDQESPLRRPIETIKESGLRAAAVVADLLTVARGVAAAKEVYDLNRLLTDYLQSPEIQRNLHDSNQITLQTNLSNDKLHINCSVSHICKCVLNLFVNGCEAIAGVGTITISTSSRTVNSSLKGYDKVRSGEYAVLSIADTGGGISPADMDHIFEPFYSKKVMGRSGTGLGLAVVWSVVQDHDGYIELTSKEGETCFELYFPLSREEIDAGQEETPLQDLQGNRQKVLVIDDEKIQRDVAKELLKSLNYKVKTVASGEDAVDWLRDNHADILLLDMIMEPGMNGRETYEKILLLHPGQKTIIASGFSDTSEVQKTLAMGAGKFIRKPYTLNRLGKVLQQELMRADGAGTR